jgi:hypothetical protein
MTGCPPEVMAGRARGLRANALAAVVMLPDCRVEYGRAVPRTIGRGTAEGQPAEPVASSGRTWSCNTGA